MDGRRHGGQDRRRDRPHRQDDGGLTSKVDEHLTTIDELTVTSISDEETCGILKIKWMADGTVVKTAEETVRTVKTTEDPVERACHQRAVGV